MRHFLYHLSVLYFFSLLASGCSQQINSEDSAGTAEAMASFMAGTVSLNCGSACKLSDDMAEWKYRADYNSKNWSDLATQIISVGYSSARNWFYLGQAAEGLGYYSIAEIYYHNAINGKNAPFLEGNDSLVREDAANALKSLQEKERQSAVQTAWNGIDENVRACFYRKSSYFDIDDLKTNGILPTDPKMAPLIQKCKSQVADEIAQQQAEKEKAKEKQIALVQTKASSDPLPGNNFLINKELIKNRFGVEENLITIVSKLETVIVVRIIINHGNCNVGFPAPGFPREMKFGETLRIDPEETSPSGGFCNVIELILATDQGTATYTFSD